MATLIFSIHDLTLMLIIGKCSLLAALLFARER